LENKAWAPSTVKTYGTSLAAYHTFCDHAGISEEDRVPAPQEILAVFMAALAGVYAASTISNYVAGVQAWHIIHGLPLNGHKQTMDAILQAALVLTPPDAKKAKQPPLLLETILTVKSCLILSTPPQHRHLCLPHLNLLMCRMFREIHHKKQRPL